MALALKQIVRALHYPHNPGPPPSEYLIAPSTLFALNGLNRRRFLPEAAHGTACFNDQVGFMCFNFDAVVG